MSDKALMHILRTISSVRIRLSPEVMSQNHDNKACNSPVCTSHFRGGCMGCRVRHVRQTAK